MIRRLSLSAFAAILLIAAQATAVFGASSEEQSNCFAQFTSNQEPGGVAESVTGNNRDAHPFGLIIVSFTAQATAPCFGEE